MVGYICRVIADERRDVWECVLVHVSFESQGESP